MRPCFSLRHRRKHLESPRRAPRGLSGISSLLRRSDRARLSPREPALPFQSSREDTVARARRRSRLTPHSSPDSRRTARITRPNRSATARPGARFIARPGEGQGVRMRSSESCANRVSARLRRACSPGGLKGRGGVDEARTRKHPRRAAGPRESSPPRAFWLLAVSIPTLESAQRAFWLLLFVSLPRL